MQTDSPKSPLDELRIDRSPEPERRLKALPIAAGIALLIAAAGLVLWARSGAGTIGVHTALAKENAGSGSQQTVLNASGYVTARRQATVSSKVTGKVVEVLIEEGMKVKEGQILARLDDTNVKAGLEVAQAQRESSKAAVEETRAQLKQAELEYARTTDLARQHIASQSDLDKAEADAKALRAHLTMLERDVTVAERQVVTWQHQMEDMIIRAPFAGVVTTKDSQPGEMISPVSAGGGYTRTGIGTVVDMDSLEIEIEVNESYINRVSPGQAVEAVLDAYPDWTIPCKVIAIIPTADRQKSTVKVRVGFERMDPRILPEMSVKVGFREVGGAGSKRLVLIPKSAVRNQDGRDVVFVVQGGRAERRAVTVDGARDEIAALSAGVSAGEAVVVDSPPGLKDGCSIREANP